MNISRELLANGRKIERFTNFNFPYGVENVEC